MTDETTQGRGARPRLPLTWAAYVAGHHGPMVGLWLDAALEQATLGLHARVDRGGRCPGLKELHRALRELAVADVVKGAVLVELHRAVDAVHACSRRLLRAWQAGDLARTSRAFVRGQEWLDVLFDLNASLFVPSAETTDWFVLGEAVGRCRRACREAAASGDFRPEVLNPVQVAAQRLRGQPESAVLVPLLAIAEPEVDRTDDVLSEARRSYLLYQELAHADAAVHSELQGIAAPQPVLVLDTERLVYYGREARLAELKKTQTAALWVLAESAGQPVTRKAIREEGRIQTPEYRLEEVISRLRTLLRSLTDAPEPTRPFHPDFLRTLIRGLGGERAHEGPYLLDLPPELVRVSPPRPAWMRHC